MWGRVLAWLRRQHEQFGLISLINLSLALLSLGTGMAALFGGSAVRAVTSAAVLLLGTSIGTWAGWHLHQDERRRAQRLLARYCDLLTRFTGPPLRILSWDDVAVVDSRGGTVETIDMQAQLESEETSFLSFRLGAGWEQPVQQRTRVTCRVRLKSVNGSAGLQGEVTTTWLDDGRMNVLVHFPAPVPAGAEVRLAIEIAWPGMCEPLMMLRQPDRFVMRFARRVEHVRYVIVLPERTEALVEPIGFAANGDHCTTRVDRTATDAVQVVLLARDIPARQVFGIQLALT